MTEELRALLVCPVTRTSLIWDEERLELVSEAAGVAFPVRDGVPVMLIEEARILPPHLAMGRPFRSSAPSEAGAIPRSPPSPRP